MSKHICDSEFSFCPSDAKEGDFYKLRLQDLSPTQFAVGKSEVAVRSARMKKKLKKNAATLHDYLRTRPVPIIIRNDKFYLIDHHHLVRALYDALHKEHKGDICIYVKVMANLSSLGDAYFWKTMHKQNWVYLFDHEGGGPQQPNVLPEHIKELAYDPYRSLAWIVRSRHGYVKNTAPFSEFKWANFFRTRILLDQDILAGKHTFDDFTFEVDENGKLMLSGDGEEIIEEALYLSTTMEARGLPGFRGQIF